MEKPQKGNRVLYNKPDDSVMDNVDVLHMEISCFSSFYRLADIQLIVFCIYRSVIPDRCWLLKTDINHKKFH